jgi:hypothetical protein
MSFSWSRYESLLNDPEPGTSIWDNEIEDEPEPDSETITCAECGYEVADVFAFDGIEHCSSCFANCLSPDLELEAEIRKMCAGECSVISGQAAVA